MKKYTASERTNWEKSFRQKIIALNYGNDPAHDLAHFQRVVAMAKRLCAEENAVWEVVVPATWLHDFVIVPKNDPRRSQASQLSAVQAVKYLESIGYES